MKELPEEVELVSVPHVGSFLDFTFESGRKVRVACHSVEEPAPVEAAPVVDESGFAESPKLHVVEGEVDESGFPQGKRQPPELGAPVAETVEGEAKEPPAEDKPVLKGKLPDDFPGKAALAAAGINTYTQLRKHGDPTDVEGIGEATAQKIAAALEGEANSEEGSESQ